MSDDNEWDLLDRLAGQDPITLRDRAWYWVCVARAKEREVARLNGWKAEANAVITEWDACYAAAAAAGHPAPLGASKARHVRRLLADPERIRREVILALRAEVERMRPVIEAVERWWGSYEPGCFGVLDAALIAYQDAVAALDAGEPRP